MAEPRDLKRVEEVGFENDFEGDRMVGGGRGRGVLLLLMMMLLLVLLLVALMMVQQEGVDLADFIADVGPFMAARFADVDDHFDFVRARLDGFVGFEEFACCRAGTVWKPDYRAEFDGRVREAEAGFAH